MDGANSEFHFEKCRQEFLKAIIDSSNNIEENVDSLVAVFHKQPGSSSDKKATLDQVFKDIVLQFIVQENKENALEKLLDLSIEAIHKDICNATLPVLLLNDIFDCVTIEKCEEMFAVIEKHVDTWKQESFFNSTKNSLLRMCNDLLRRLSRSQNTVFCGRILLFLAKFFPLSERSGLNVVSEFNVDNVTIFGTKDDMMAANSFSHDKGDQMEVDEDNNPSAIRVDYNLYRKFWALQEYFHNPNQCYNKISWRTFTAYSDEVLKAFKSCKLDDIKSSYNCTQNPTDQLKDLQVYFAKYLTNPKLLDLQLSDGNFRRCILVQYLILFQYLQTAVKFKQETYILTEEQVLWITSATERIYKLLGETPPNAAKFSKSIEHILKREEHWSVWKNEGCPDFQKPPSETVEPPKPSRPKRKLGDEIKAASAHNKFILGNPHLTKLWNLCPDNMEACRSPKRDFLPSLESFFEEAIEQSDPANMIEDEYKHVNNGNYGWRALRLLARRSLHFFIPNNQPINKLPIFLETMIKKVAKELPQHTSTEENKTELQEKPVVGDNEDSEDELLRNSEEVSKDDNGKDEAFMQEQVTMDQIQIIAEKLELAWKKLAVKLGCEEDEIVYYESECSGPVEQGQRMLTVWRDNLGEKATLQELSTPLCKLGYDALVKDLLKHDV